MTTLQWSTAAEADVDKITDYIARHNPIAAIEMRDRIETRVKFLKTFPEGWNRSHWRHAGNGLGWDALHRNL